jgi:hypothetical protein
MKIYLNIIMNQSHLPKVLQYTMEKSPEPRPEPTYQTDIDSTLLHTTCDAPQTEEDALENPLSLEGAIDPPLAKIEREKVVPDDIFDKIQKKLVREKKKLNHRKPAPQQRKVKEDESDYMIEEQQITQAEEESLSDDDDIAEEIKKSYVKFKEEPKKIKQKKRVVSPPPPAEAVSYPAGTKLNKNGKPRKVLTDAQKEARKLALAKGRETRRLNAIAKKKANGEPYHHLEKKSEPIDIPKKDKASERASQSFNKEDLVESQLEAIERYEAIRKERKQQKKVAKAIQQQKDDIKNVVRRETTWQTRAGAFSSCY